MIALFNQILMHGILTKAWRRSYADLREELVGSKRAATSGGANTLPHGITGARKELGGDTTTDTALRQKIPNVKGSQVRICLRHSN